MSVKHKSILSVLISSFLCISNLQLVPFAEEEAELTEEVPAAEPAEQETSGPVPEEEAEILVEEETAPAEAAENEETENPEEENEETETPEEKTEVSDAQEEILSEEAVLPIEEEQKTEEESSASDLPEEEQDESEASQFAGTYPVDVRVEPQSYTVDVFIPRDQEDYLWNNGTMVIVCGDGFDALPDQSNYTETEITAAGLQTCSQFGTDWVNNEIKFVNYRGTKICLYPDTEYTLQLMAQSWDDGTYAPLSERVTFTTLGPVESSEVKVFGGKSDDGYYHSVVTFDAYNPQHEFIAQSYLADEDGNKLCDAYYDPLIKHLYDAYLDTHGQKMTVYPAALVYTGNKEEKIVYGEPVSIEPIIFDLSQLNYSVSAGTESVTLSMTLDSYRIEDNLSVVLSLDGNVVNYGYFNSGNSVTTQTGLTPDTEYTLSFAIYDGDESPDYLIYESDDIKVRTAADSIVPSSEFDPGLYDYLLTHGYDRNADSQLSVSELENGNDTQLTIDVNDVAKPLNTLKGIHYLKNLEDIFANGHNLYDISDIVSLEKLRSINFLGNDLKTLPDLSGLKNLQDVYLFWNLLDEEGLAAGHLPKRVLSMANAEEILEKQRTEGIRVLEKYYAVENKRPFLIIPKNAKLSRDYTAELVVKNISTGQSWTFDQTGCFISNVQNAMIWPDLNDKAGTTLPEGEYEASIRLVDKFGNVSADETVRFVFAEDIPNIIRPIFIDGNYSGDLNFYVSGTHDQSDISIRLMDQNGEDVPNASLSISYVSDNLAADNRYMPDSTITYLMDRPGTSIATQITCTDLPAGSYDAAVTVAGKEYTVKNVITSVGYGDTPVVTGVERSDRYDNSRDYLYLRVIGYNLAEDTLRPVLKDKYGNLAAEEVPVAVLREDPGYITFKLRKTGDWSDIPGVYITLLSEHEFTDNRDSNYLRIPAMSAYVVYASVRDTLNHQVIAFFSESVSEGTPVTGKLYLNNASKLRAANTPIATDETVVNEGHTAVFRFRDADGNDIRFDDSLGTYYVTYDIEGEVLHSDELPATADYSEKEFDPVYSDQAGISTSAAIRHGDTEDTLILSVTANDHVTDKEQIAYRLVNSENTMVAEKSLEECGWIHYEAGGKNYYRTELIWNLNALLEPGEYKLQTVSHAEVTGEKSLAVPADPSLFSMTSQTAVMAGNLFVRLSSVTVAEDLKEAGTTPEAWTEKGYEIRLLDENQTLLENWTLKAVTDNADYTELEIAGVPDAINGVYCRITKDGKVPVSTADQTVSWYSASRNGSDDTGIYTWFGAQKYAYCGRSGKLAGVRFPEASLPGTIKIMEPNAMDALVTIAVTEDMLKDGAYQFTEEDVSGLEADHLYKIVVNSTGNGSSYTLFDYPEAYVDMTEIIHVSGITVEPETAEIDPEEQIQLKAVIYPAEADNQRVVWSSDNEDAASVDETGLVTGVGDGTAVITAETEDGGYSAECTVTVTGPQPEIVSITVTPKTITLLEGDAYQLEAATETKGEGTARITWSSDHPEIVSVDNGLITAVAEGTAVITAQAGEKTAVCTVTAVKRARPAVTDVFTYENGYRTTLKDHAVMEKNMPVYFEANTGSRLFYKINDGEYRESTGYCFEGEEVTLTIKAVNEQGEESEEYVLNIEEKDHSWESEPGDVIPEDAETAGDTIPEGLWVTDLEESVKYTGKAIKLTGFRVYNYKTLLKSGTDYTVSYKDNKNAGEATLVIKGKGNYSGTVELPFTIEQIDLSETTAKNIQLKNTGAEQVIKPAVKWGSKTLKKDIDYTVSEITDTAFWTNGGEQTVTLTGKGNYAGNREITVYIPKVEEVLMSKASIKLSAKTVEYGEKPEVTVTYKQLPVDAKAYEVIYPEDQAGKTALIVKGTGETDENLNVAFNGEKSLSYTIKGTALSKKTVTVEGNTSAVYTGKYQESELKLAGLSEGTDYEVEQARGLKAGKYTAVFTGKGAYSGTYKVTWTITANNEITLSTIPDQAYATGGATPEVTVTDGNGTKLVKGTDYTVKYTNNKKIGTATVKVTGKGNYKGASDEGTFEIHARDLSALNVSAKDVNFTNKKNKYRSTPAVTDINGKKVAAKEYTVTYTYADGRPIGANDIPEAGTVIRATVTGKGTNYTGTKSTEYRVIEKTGNISDTKVYEAEVMGYHAYTGIPVQPGTEEIELRDKAGNRYYDFEVVSYGANNKKGTGTVVIRGINTLGGTRTIKFPIFAYDLDETDVIEP